MGVEAESEQSVSVVTGDNSVTQPRIPKPASSKCYQQKSRALTNPKTPQHRILTLNFPEPRATVDQLHCLPVSHITRDPASHPVGSIDQALLCTPELLSKRSRPTKS